MSMKINYSIDIKASIIKFMIMMPEQPIDLKGEYLLNELDIINNDYGIKLAINGKTVLGNRIAIHIYSPINQLTYEDINFLSVELVNLFKELCDNKN